MTVEELEDAQYDTKCAIAAIVSDCEIKTCTLYEINALCKTANCDNWQSVIERIQELIFQTSL